MLPAGFDCPRRRQPLPDHPRRWRPLVNHPRRRLPLFSHPRRGHSTIKMLCGRDPLARRAVAGGHQQILDGGL